MPTDAELLRRYVEGKAEDAFAALVRRHLNFVYAAALRRTNGRHGLAEEISQRVFTDLARKAVHLISHPTITGWLYRSTRFAAIDAIRIEQRREKLARALTTMPDASPPAESTIDWEHLRPAIDAAMDQLKEPDREIMLLRFFQGLTFAEVGERLNLSENAARMRTERALDKLRGQLGRRGITSSATLAGLLTSESLVAAPANLAATVTTTALAATSVGAAGVITTILMNKITLTTISAALAAGLTSFAWVALAQDNSSQELNALRSENIRLTQATVPAAATASIAIVADEFTAQATQIMHRVELRVAERNAVANGRHRNHGQATPHDALLSHAWASDTGDVTALAKLLTFDEKGAESVRILHAGLPAAIRSQFHTPEEFVAFLFIADTFLYPVPGADVVDRCTITELRPGRVTLRPPGATQGGLEFQQTGEGWKNEVPGDYPKVLAERILGNEMLAKLNAR